MEGAGGSKLFQLAFVQVRNRQYLVLSIAHALYDGWSLGLLHRDVHAAYNGEYVARETYIPYLGHILQSGSQEADNFWEYFLTGAVPTCIPPKIQDNGGTKIVNRTEASSSTPLAVAREYCANHAISLQVMGQACWAAVLSRLVGSLDISFGVVLSGRETEAVECLLFPTMNTIIVRTLLLGTVSGLLQYMHENMININQFQHYPHPKSSEICQSGSRRSVQHTVYSATHAGFAEWR